MAFKWLYGQQSCPHIRKRTDYYGALKCKCSSKRINNVQLSTFLTSAFSSFQILTQEDWNKVLYNGMASTSSWAALYFIALMTFGNYVLFNLLVAILVEGFQTEVKP